MASLASPPNKLARLDFLDVQRNVNNLKPDPPAALADTRKVFPLPLFRQAIAWLSKQTAEPAAHYIDLRGTEPAVDTGKRRIQLVVIVVTIFIIAIGVRLLHWQDHGIIVYYRPEAQRILDGGGTFFPSSAPQSGDATMVVHPPGYSILMGGIFTIFGDSDSAITIVQIIGDALAAVMVLVIAAELLPLTVAIISGILVALSPHLASYSVHLSPESPAVLPILLAIYFLVQASKRPRLISFIAVGASIGLSCWLRSNALLLSPFIGIAIIVFFRHRKRVRHAGVVVLTTVLVIAPITVRNWIVFHQFIPLSIGAGVTLIEGIADYDSEDRFGFPKLDGDVQTQEAELYGRPEYARNLEAPDGIERDRARFARGLQVVRSNPIWFLGVMVRRAAFMLRYNDSRARDWPFYTAVVPIISSEPTPRRSLRLADETQPIWVNSPSDFIRLGTVISPQAKVIIDDKAWHLEGDNSDYGDEVVSEVINVQKNTDHMLEIPVKLDQGQMAIKLTSVDRSIALASANINSIVEKSALLERRRKKRSGVLLSDGTDTRDEQNSFIQLPFASGNRTQVRIALSNNGPSPSPSQLSVGEAKIFALGTTPYLWTRFPRVIIRGIQRKLFTTTIVLALIISGIALLALAGRGRAVSILLIVPVYYLVIQSALHTEYRYILAIHYFLFVMAAAALFCFGSALWQGIGSAVTAFRKRA